MMLQGEKHFQLVLPVPVPRDHLLQQGSCSTCCSCSYSSWQWGQKSSWMLLSPLPGMMCLFHLPLPNLQNAHQQIRREKKEQRKSGSAAGTRRERSEMLYRLSQESYLWVEQPPVPLLYSHLLLLVLLKEKWTGSQGTFYRLVSSQRHEGSRAISSVSW